MIGNCWGTWLIMLGFMDLGWPRVCRRSTSVLFVWYEDQELSYNKQKKYKIWIVSEWRVIGVMSSWLFILTIHPKKHVHSLHFIGVWYRYFYQYLPRSLLWYLGNHNKVQAFLPSATDRYCPHSCRPTVLLSVCLSVCPSRKTLPL